MSGDTLSKIAATHYGTRSGAVITALFEANRSVLSSPDVLQVGMELTLPDINGLKPRSAVASTADPRNPARPREGQRARTPFRWYQIRKNDRYVSIAREQLGDARRWREIYELNKDKFPDPERIREGVRIKLPAASLAVAAGSRR